MSPASSGKWHLGYEPEFSPNRHGFDYAFYVLGGGVDYFHHCEPNGESVLRLNEQPIRRNGYFTDLVTEEAVDFIRREAGKPFFLYVPYTAPHAPYQGPGDCPPQPLPESSELHNQDKGRPRPTGHDRADGRGGRPHRQDPGRKRAARQITW